LDETHKEKRPTEDGRFAGSPSRGNKGKNERGGTRTRKPKGGYPSLKGVLYSPGLNQQRIRRHQAAAKYGNAQREKSGTPVKRN